MLHTRVVVKSWYEGDLFVRCTVDRGARFRDEAHIAEVTEACKAECLRSVSMAAPSSRGEPRFRVETREV